MSLRSKLRATQRVLLLSLCLYSNTVFGQRPHYIGRTSCATATCHGGLIGDGPVWQSSSSRWESSDRHRAAGEALLSDLSRRIVAGLELSSMKDSAVFSNVLKDRCVSCHAPEANQATSDDLQERTASFRQQLSRGVGCESCHGPASVWEKLHTQNDWADKNRFDANIGMRETEPLLGRVDNCARCHVGSRTADDTIRDMNHDMIAAGHPPLAFDMYRYDNALPEHWSLAKSAFQQKSPAQLVNRAAATRARVLSLVARLSTERRGAAPQVPQPELSEFECAACHHSLSPGSRPIHSMGSNASSNGTSSNGFPSWNAWLTLSNSLDFAKERLRLDSIDLDKQIATIAIGGKQRSQKWLEVEVVDPLPFLMVSLSSALKDSRLREKIVADPGRTRAWFDQIEIATHAASFQISEKGRNKTQMLLGRFRSEKLGEVADQSISARILTRVVCNAGDVEKLCNELILAMKE